MFMLVSIFVGVKVVPIFLDWVGENYAGQTVLAVGHGIINKAIQAVHYGLQTREVPKMSNAEYRLLQL